MNATKKQTKGGTDQRRRLRLALGGLLGALAMPACANHVSVPAEISTCPCANGAFCCSSGVCAADTTGCDVATAALSNSVAGEWQGYFENYSLSAESQSLTADDSLGISIVVANDGTMSGHVTMGQVAPAAPPTDPGAIWPPGLDLTLAAFTPDYPAYVPGFAYQAKNIRWEAQRLRFEIDSHEAWQSWCQLQPSYPQAAGGYGCVPGNAHNLVGNPGDPLCSVNDDTGGTLSQVSCRQFVMCVFCACDASGCGAAPTVAYTFDIALRDGIGDGTTSLTTSPIRLNQISQN